MLLGRPGKRASEWLCVGLAFGPMMWTQKLRKLSPLCCLEFRQIDSQEHSFVLGHETASKLSLSQSAGARQFPAPATCSDEGSDLHDPGRWVGNPEKKKGFWTYKVGFKGVNRQWTIHFFGGNRWISTLALASSWSYMDLQTHDSLVTHPNPCPGTCTTQGWRICRPNARPARSQGVPKVPR